VRPAERSASYSCLNRGGEKRAACNITADKCRNSSEAAYAGR
jgi:hypothetical protein